MYIRRNTSDRTASVNLISLLLMYKYTEHTYNSEMLEWLMLPGYYCLDRKWHCHLIWNKKEYTVSFAY